jgi:beta-galactosidase
LAITRFAKAPWAAALALVLGLFSLGFAAIVQPRRLVEIRNTNGSFELYIYGRPVVPLMFFGQPSIDRTIYLDQVRRARDASIHLYSIEISMPWPRPGEDADYSDGDLSLEETEAMDPSALVLLRFNVGPPDWWLDAHPDDRMVFEDGTVEGWSPASAAWADEMLVWVREFVRHYESRFGRLILGYHPCGQMTGEWFYFDSWDGRLSDFSPTMNSGFRLWLKDKYGTVDELRSAWGRDDLTFETVEIPAAAEQRRTSIGFFRDPERERNIIDFFEYKQEAMEQPLERIARAVKEETAGQKLVCFFYGYLFEMHGLPAGPQGSGHLALARLLENKDVDIVCSPISYFDRGPGGAGCFMAAVDSVLSAGKMWFNEDDTRTYLSSPDDPFGRAATPQQTIWIHRRNFGLIWPRRLGCWYMDLPGAGWLSGDDLWENIGRLSLFYRHRLTEPPSWSPEVALIVDERSPFYTCCSSALHAPLVYQMRSAFYRLGATVRIHLLSDLVSGRMPPAKVYVFLNCFHLSSRERAAVFVLTHGKTAVWFYGGGFLDTDATDDHISLVTGISVVRGVPQAGKALPDPSGGVLVMGLGETFGTQRRLDPLWIVSDPRAQILARFGDGTPAVAAKWTPAGLRVYIGTLSAPAQFLRNVLKASGVHLYMDSDDAISTDGRFLAVTATSAGSKTIVFPRRVTLTDALDGSDIARGVDRFSLLMEFGETRLFMVR